jgi:TetR/AcrR family transcriptional repressor of nem operon
MHMKATKPLTHREKLVREGTKQLYAYGFHGTTVDRVLAASGVPKGSFYHHFGSKEAFAKEALDRYMRFQLDLLATWAEREDIDTADAVTGYFGAMAEAFARSHHERACLLGKLSTEMAAGSPEFRELLANDIQQWRQALVARFERGREQGDIREDLTLDDLADAVLALIQGVFVLALAVRNQTMLDATATTLRLLIRRG